MLKNTFHWSLIKKRKHILDSYDITLLHVDVRQLEMDTVNLLLCVPNDNYSIVMIEIHMLHKCSKIPFFLGSSRRLIGMHRRI